MPLKIPPRTGWPSSQKITWLKGATEDEMVGWHHRLSGHEFEHEMMKDGEAWCAAVHEVGHD